MSSKLRLFSKSFNHLYRSQAIAGRSLVQLQSKPIISKNIRLFSTTLQQKNIYTELNQFLVNEIKLEKETRKNQTQTPKLKGFDLKAEGPNITLTKAHNNETITIKLNVNDSLDITENVDDTVADAERDPSQSPEPMKARPSFTVDIKKGDKVLAFACSFLPPEEGSKDSNEDFQIDEFAIHDGEWNENVYTVNCTVLDGQLYDILLNLLEERGLGEQFANDLAEFSTSFEHLQYVGLLEKLKEFSQ